MTIDHALQTATEKIDRADAEILLAYILDTDRAGLLARSSDELAEGEQACFDEFVTWRAEGQPVAHLINRQDFYGLTFTVDETVLIPRPDTEVLVEAAIAHIGDRPLTVLDVGTGSGCIAVAIAKNTPHSTVIGSDISQAALDIAEKNATDHDLDLTFHQSDLLEGIDTDVDVLVSNPPYIAEDDPELEGAVRAHEPERALFAEEGGLVVIEKLLTQTAAREKKPELILIEHGAAQGQATREIAVRLFPEAQVETLQDLAGRDRVLKIQLN